jgi:tripartite-type tricarboxylate transporter receptor subunit TctC
MPSRRQILVASAAASALVTVPRVLAQSTTITKPLRIVVPFPAGGATDVIARLIADKLRGTYAPATLVDNRVGASGRIGVEAVKNADPDGSTILFTPDFLMTVYPHSFKKLAYDPVRDFAPVGIASRSSLALSAGPGLPQGIRTVPEFVEWCKANPNKASFATTAPGGTPHFVGVMLSRAAGVPMQPVHYKGGAPALQDLLGGQIPVSVNPVGEILPHARAGKIRVLATTGTQRGRFLPDAPTFVDAGFKDIVVESWLGFMAPAKTPPDTIMKLFDAIADALKGQDIAAGFEKFAVDLSPSTPTMHGMTMRSDIARWGPIVQASGFTAEE